jgi:hypothetical protein
MPVRTLRNSCYRAKTSVTEWIKHRRLEGWRRELAGPHLFHRPFHTGAARQTRGSVPGRLPRGALPARTWRTAPAYGVTGLPPKVTARLPFAEKDQPRAPE